MSYGIWQSDSLNHMLLNIIMNNNIDDIRPMKGHKMVHLDITIVCYADNAVLIVDNGDSWK